MACCWPTSYAIAQDPPKWAVLFFLSETCPISKSVTQEIRELLADSTFSDVLFLAVFPMLTSTEASAKAFLDKYALPIPMTLDAQHLWVQTAEVGVVPTALVLPQSHANLLEFAGETDLPLFYKGRIDTSFEHIGKRRRNNIERTLYLALSHIIQADSPYPEAAPAVGCLITPQKNTP